MTMATAQDKDKPRTGEDAGLWWVEYGKGLSDLATAIATGDRARRLSVRESLHGATTKWGSVMGHPLASALMGEQVALLSAFADAAAASRKPAMGAFLDQAIENVEEQSRLYSADSVNFPKDRFRDAFLRHTVRTAAYIQALMAGEKRMFESSFSKALEARNELSGIWLLPSKEK